MHGLTKTAHIVVSSPTRDVGLTPESPCAGQNPGTYRTRSGRAVIRPARFTARFPPLLFVRLRECLFQATDVKQGLFNFTHDQTNFFFVLLQSKVICRSTDEPLTD